MIKYVVFLVIFAVSFSSIMAAFGLAEIEPFKTAITMKFMRNWQFVAYAAALLAVGVFIERFFCRYFCPLGAALAIPARMRMFEWLKRYRECGNECHICARRCTVQAIHPLGQINPNECIHCLKCQANYYDPNVCIHVKRRIERRNPRTGRPQWLLRPEGAPMSREQLSRRRAITIIAAAAAGSLAAPGRLGRSPPASTCGGELRWVPTQRSISAEFPQ